MLLAISVSLTNEEAGGFSWESFGNYSDIFSLCIFSFLFVF